VPIGTHGRERVEWAHLKRNASLRDHVISSSKS